MYVLAIIDNFTILLMKFMSGIVLLCYQGFFFSFKNSSSQCISMSIIYTDTLELFKIQLVII